MTVVLAVAMTVVVVVSVTVAMRGCSEDVKLARCWWYTVTVDVAVSVTVAVKACHEDVKLDSVDAGGAPWILVAHREEKFGDSDCSNFVGDVSGTLGVDITPLSTVEFLLAAPGSLLSESTAVCQYEEVDDRVRLTVAMRF